jgi:hypothetical protein
MSPASAAADELEDFPGLGVPLEFLFGEDEPAVDHDLKRTTS